MEFIGDFYMLKDRFKEIRLERGLSQQEIADKAGVSQSTIMFLENGRNQSSRRIVEIAKVLGVNSEWLVTGKGEKYSSVNIPIKTNKDLPPELEGLVGLDPWDDNTPLHPHEVEIPYLKDVHLSAGNGCFALEDYSGLKLRFSKYTLKNKGVDPASAVCVTADGDSMEPVIPSGCTVAVDTGSKNIKDGQIYAINNDGLLQIKILRWISGSQVSIESYNPSHKPTVVNVSDFSVIGRVFWYSVLL